MNFSDALYHIKNNYLLSRTGWVRNNTFIFLVQGSNFIVNRRPLIDIFQEGTEINYHAHIDKRNGFDGTIVPWVPSQEDILADDWVIIPNPKT